VTAKSRLLPVLVVAAALVGVAAGVWLFTRLVGA
jgi:hypothetical protein